MKLNRFKSLVSSSEVGNPTLYRELLMPSSTSRYVPQLCVTLDVTAHRSLFLFFVLLLSSCAQVLSPVGGPKDTTPPQVINYEPDSAAINFNAKKISIVFNEYIQTKELNSQLFVSPLMKELPEVTVKNKTLLISISDTLKKNTTYTINFGNAITDFTEGNPAAGFQYVFSTGNHIDSLSIKGTIQTALDHKTDAGILVMLYSRLGDSIPLKKKPDYYAKTNKAGNYKIDHLPSGKYKVFALKDANSNLMYDAADEIMGFYENPFELSKDTTLNMELFTAPLSKQFVKKAMVEHFGKLLLVFNHPVEKLSLTPLNFQAKKQWEIIEYSAKKDSVSYWFTDMGMDTIKLLVQDNNKIIDTVKLKLITKADMAKPVMSGRSERKFELSVLSNTTGGFLDLGKNLVITFNHPIKEFDLSKVELKNAGKLVSIEGGPKDEILRKFELKASLLEDSSYVFFAPPGAFTDVYGLKNDSIKISFKVQPERYYGSMKLNIKLGEQKGNFVLQLLNSNEAVAMENQITESGIINYNRLAPGIYKVKLIYDTNKNGKWDEGTYFKKIQAEKTKYYSGTITIRSNWDLEQEWIVK